MKDSKYDLVRALGMMFGPAIILCTILFLFSTCGSVSTDDANATETPAEVVETVENPVIDDGTNFVCVAEYSTFVIKYNTKTLVMYAVSDDTYNHGTFTVLVNADGSPMLWEGATD